RLLPICVWCRYILRNCVFFFSSRRRHTRSKRDWSSDVCSSDLVCTNHFHVLDEENRYRQDESRQREETIKEQQKYTTNPMQAFRVMNDPQYNVFSKRYDAAAGTIHTAAYFPKEMKAWFAMGHNQPPVIFDFQKWLHGQDVFVKKIKGQLDYT